MEVTGPSPAPRSADIPPNVSQDVDMHSDSSSGDASASRMSEKIVASGTGFVHRSHDSDEKEALNQDPGKYVSPPISPPTSPPTVTRHGSYFREQEGLQVYHPEPTTGVFANSAMDPAFRQGHVEKEVHQPTMRELSSGETPPPKKTRRKRGIIAIIVAAVVVVVVVAGAVGGVLGSRKSGAGGSSSGSGSSTNGASANAPPPRVNSTRGALNGTGLLIMGSSTVQNGYYQCMMIFQNYIGQVQSVNVGLSTNAVNNESLISASSAVMADNPVDINIQAARGTSFAGQQFSASGNQAETFVVVYVDQGGVLSDIWTNRNSPGIWTGGSLASSGFQGVTGGRGAMLLESASCYGSNTEPSDPGNWSQTGMRLWAGHPDGTIHQYSYDTPSQKWSNSNVSIKGTDAWSGLAMGRRFSDASCFNDTVLITSGKDGSTSFLTSTPGSSDADIWPDGPIWSAPIASQSNATSDSYSGLTFSLLDDFENIANLSAGNLLSVGSGSLLTTEVDVDDTGSSGHLATAMLTESAMDGSAVSSAGFQSGTNGSLESTGRGINIIVYQNNGTSINWAIQSANHSNGNILW